MKNIAREITGKSRNRLFVYDQYLAVINQGTEVPSRWPDGSTTSIRRWRARDLCHLASCRRRGVGQITTFDRALLPQAFEVEDFRIAFVEVFDHPRSRVAQLFEEMLRGDVG